MTTKAIQDYYPDEFAHCFGCGHMNKEGHQIKSFPEGDETICHFKPDTKYSGGYPGNIYGGMIASLLDCHSAATASYVKLKEEGFTLEERPPFRFVTASLKVDFLKPAPSGEVFELRAHASEIKGRKVIIQSTLSANGEVKARGEAVMVQIPDER
ncbi:MAG TPA: PaaI family thioesterase [Spirochaetota bacterium]|nr:PaaI family thioesterase [Spirochaetota bacterium]HPJ33352.1 PaaI family thioesterase [Spirochaetota bacterium]